MKKPFLIYLLVLCDLVFFNMPKRLLAQDMFTRNIDVASERNKAVDLKAEELIYEKEIGNIIARGNVELVQKDRILKADSITYNTKTDTVIAKGNLILVDPEGNVTFADYVELKDELKSGFIENIRMTLSDESKMAARKLSRKDGVKDTLENAVYSPCDVCKDKDPVWQVKATSVTYDRIDKKISYKNAWLEMFGYPVLYTPYLSHPSPEVKRKSGFLFPLFGSGSEIGSYTTIPYFISYGDHNDMTLSYMTSRKEDDVFLLESRNNLNNGYFNFNTSITDDKEGELRGHLFSKGEYDINDYWRATGEINRSSNDNYMRKYRFDRSSDAWYESNLKFEGFDNRDYAYLKAYNFQNLRTDLQDDTIPIAVPLMNYNYVGEPSSLGSYQKINFNSATIYRDKGSKNSRWSFGREWVLPYTSKYGENYKLSTLLRGDAYFVEDEELEDGSLYDGLAGRIYPLLSFDWSYPLARVEKASTQVIEPLINVSVAPRGGNSDRIPNEDSQDIDLNTSNIMDSNIFPGYDKVEDGSKITAGGKWSTYGDEKGQASVFLGETFHLTDPGTYPENSGLENKKSDYVGRIYVSPNENLHLNYRFRLDSETFAAKRNEASMNIGNKMLNFGIDYLFDKGLKDKESTKYKNEDRHEINFALKSKLTKYWDTSYSYVYDLADNGGPLSYEGHLIYNDECFTFDVSLDKKYYESEVYKDDWTIMAKITFKSLGTIATD